MKEFLIDTSFLVSYLAHDEQSIELHSVFEDFLNGKCEFYILDLTYYEVFNAFKSMVTSKRLSQKDAEYLVELVQEMDLKQLVPDYDNAFKLAIKNNLSFYDSCYLEVSISRKKNLLTLDKRLQNLSFS